jgi:hypothetical protein
MNVVDFGGGIDRDTIVYRDTATVCGQARAQFPLEYGPMGMPGYVTYRQGEFTPLWHHVAHCSECERLGHLRWGDPKDRLAAK